ncbi:MAG: glycoside hydrolase family 3 N-terminal domain-containing protein [Thermodesulfobacteriota bacterium]
MMKHLIALLAIVVAFVLAPFAWDWRAPFLVDMRPQMLMGLIGLPLILMFLQAWVLRTVRTEQRLLKVLAAAGMLAAALVLTTTLALEARFHWMRYQVLHADPSRLERLGRHFIVGYRDIAEVRELVKLRAIAGIFISAHNVGGKSAAEVRQEIQSFQKERREQGLPRLWIATDQEGGIVSRLSPPLTPMPALSEIVQSHSDVAAREEAVRKLARIQARELADIGVNLNFAPVVDVNHQVVNPNDLLTRIYRRAISSDPAVVTQVANWYCSTLEEAGVRCTLKHFPGLGRVFEDTHREHANLSAPITELTDTDWIPFRVLMRESRAFTMLGHVRLTEVDPERPVSASPSVVAGMIRGDWKHDGVLITDNFSMIAVYRSAAGIEKASIDALNAGVDLLLISYDPDQYYRVMYALLKADEQNKLNKEVLRRSDERLVRAIQEIP